MKKIGREKGRNLKIFQTITVAAVNPRELGEAARKDATLLEVLTTLRAVGPSTPEYRHPLARYSFRAVYADAASRGTFATKDLGTVYSRDILGEPGSLDSPAARLLEEHESGRNLSSERQKEARTLDELRFVPGDYLCISVLLPKNSNPAPGTELSIRGSAAAPPNGWKAAGPLGPPRVGGFGVVGAPAGRGSGGHWRGESNGPSNLGRGRGGRGDVSGRDREVRGRDDRDSRVPPPRRNRDSPPRGGWGERDRPPRGRSMSRSRSPPRRRR
ncbi:hypothetical protein OF83DRAFT_1163040 [Amylostereum chailletii]|nr:hypothetical protein OF83DRAFT_1163040 [Amylostereum chailletii]